MSHWRDHRWVSWFYCITLDSLQVKRVTCHPRENHLQAWVGCHSILTDEPSSFRTVSSLCCLEQTLSFHRRSDLRDRSARSCSVRSLGGVGDRKQKPLFCIFHAKLEYFKSGLTLSKSSSTSCVQGHSWSPVFCYGLSHISGKGNILKDKY